MPPNSFSGEEHKHGVELQKSENTGIQRSLYPQPVAKQLTLQPLRPASKPLNLATCQPHFSSLKSEVSSTTANVSTKAEDTAPLSAVEGEAVCAGAAERFTPAPLKVGHSVAVLEESLEYGVPDLITKG
jgi:hypothetical protein